MIVGLAFVRSAASLGAVSGTSIEFRDCSQVFGSNRCVSKRRGPNHEKHPLRSSSASEAGVPCSELSLGRSCEFA